MTHLASRNTAYRYQEVAAWKPTSLIETFSSVSVLNTLVLNHVYPPGVHELQAISSVSKYDAGMLSAVNNGHQTQVIIASHGSEVLI